MSRSSFVDQTPIPAHSSEAHADRSLTISPIDTNGNIPSKRGIAADGEFHNRPLVRDDAGGIMPENYREALAEFIQTKGITRCPTACVLPTQGLVPAADRVALEEHAVERDRLRRAQAAARRRPSLNLKAAQ
jgi:hypothetical protein